MGVDIKDTQLNCVLNSNLKNTRKDTTWPQSYSTSIQYFLGLMPLPIMVSEKFPYHYVSIRIFFAAVSHIWLSNTNIPIQICLSETNICQQYLATDILVGLYKFYCDTRDQKLSYLIVFQEVSRLEGEEQGHVIIQRVFAVDIIGFVLQQPACLVQHPIRRMDSNLRLSLVIFNMHCYVQLSPPALRPFTIVFVVIS